MLGAVSGESRPDLGVLDRVEITNEEYLRFIHATAHPEPETARLHKERGRSR
jgi:hypothetical protein